LREIFVQVQRFLFDVSAADLVEGVTINEMITPAVMPTVIPDGRWSHTAEQDCKRIICAMKINEEIESDG
jgi:hypothetical protein